MHPVISHPTPALRSLICLALFLAPSVAAADPPAPPAGLRSIEDVKKEAHAGVTFISVDELKRRIQTEDRFVLLDVRTAKEFDAGHLKGATWLERGIAEFVMLRKLPEPNVQIVVYCKAGHRSSLVVKALRSVGYKQVVALEGGFDNWANRGNPIVNVLGEFKSLKLLERNAGSEKVEFFEPKR